MSLYEKIIKIINGKNIKWIYTGFIIIGLLYSFFRITPIEDAYISDSSIKDTFIETSEKFTRITLPYKKSGDKKRKLKYKIIIKSRITHSVPFHISVDDIIKNLIINDTYYDLGKIKTFYKQKELKDWKTGYIFYLNLKKGKNTIVIHSINTSLGYSITFNQRLSIIDFFVLFFLFIIPVFHGFIFLFFKILDNVKNYNFERITQLDFSRINWPLLILVTGILIRILYVISYGYGSYNHDHHHHMSFIKFMSVNFTIPLPDKGTEFAQQPFYYILSGIIYSLSGLIFKSKEIITHILSWLSCGFTIIFMCYMYKLIKLITEKKFIRTVFMAILSFTPSFIYISGRINNDVLVLLLSGMILFYITRFFMKESKKDFTISLILVSLVFLTKISAALWALFLFIILVRKYLLLLKNENTDNIKEKKIVKNRIVVVTLVSLIIFSLSLYRAYLPSTGGFRFVNSGKIKGQIIVKQDLPYFLSFNISELISKAQAYTYGKHNQKIKQSFPTFQYGTFMFGEYDYRKIRKKHLLFKSLIQLIYLFGLILITGGLAYLFYFKKQPVFIRYLFIVIMVNLILIINFSLMYPSACNTDFRYFIPSFAVISLIIAFGLDFLRQRFIKIKKTVNLSLIALFSLEIIWLIYLILIGTRNSIT